MARSTERPRWVRRTRRLAVLAAVVGAIGMVRARRLEQEQRAFDSRYPAAP